MTVFPALPPNEKVGAGRDSRNSNPTDTKVKRRENFAVYNETWDIMGQGIHVHASVIMLHPRNSGH